MQQRFGDLDAAPQAAGERLHQIVAAVGQAQPLHGALHALAQRRAAQPVQVALRAQILFHGERLIQALRLEHHADAAAHCGGFARHIVPGDFGAALGGHHHGGENAEERGFAAAIRSQQAEDLALLHFEADIRERDAVSVAVGQVLN